ncbi:uncharacterized protein [Bos indicus]|uniref:Uncharacterized protein isoform X5 n=1 Tax=Bos indicus TaxID=9915 RepID=A0ABM4QW16_BOSIN
MAVPGPLPTWAEIRLDFPYPSPILSCVSVRSDYAWCSIDEMFQGRWRYCTAKGGLFITEPAQKPLMWFNHLENSSVW